MKVKIFLRKSFFFFFSFFVLFRCAFHSKCGYVVSTVIRWRLTEQRLIIIMIRQRIPISSFFAFRRQIKQANKQFMAVAHKFTRIRAVRPATRHPTKRNAILIKFKILIEIEPNNFEPYAHFVGCLLTFIKIKIKINEEQRKNQQQQQRWFIGFVLRPRGQHEMHRLESVVSIYI